MQLTGGSPCVLDLMQCSEVSDLVHSVQCSDIVVAVELAETTLLSSSHFGCHASHFGCLRLFPLRLPRISGQFNSCFSHGTHQHTSTGWNFCKLLTCPFIVLTLRTYMGSLSGLYFYVFGSLNSLAQRWIFPLKQELRFLLYFFSNQGVSCRNIGQEQLTHNTIRIQ